MGAFGEAGPVVLFGAVGVEDPGLEAIRPTSAQRFLGLAPSAEGETVTGAARHTDNLPEGFADARAYHPERAGAVVSGVADTSILGS